MDELTLLRDTHRVEQPDPELIARQRIALQAHIATSPAHERMQDSRHSGRRTRRGPLLAGALAIGLIAGVGAAAATGLFDGETQQMVASTGCNISTDDAHLAVSATDSRGSVIELWTIDTSEGFANLIVERNPDGTTSGASMGCDAQPRATAYPPGQPWAAAPNLTDGEATLVRLYGRLPDDAVTASIELSDGTVATVHAASDGYFLQPITMAPNPDIDVVGITAFASDGTVIATSPSP